MTIDTDSLENGWQWSMGPVPTVSLATEEIQVKSCIFINTKISMKSVFYFLL